MNVRRTIILNSNDRLITRAHFVLKLKLTKGTHHHNAVQEIKRIRISKKIK